MTPRTETDQAKPEHRADPPGKSRAILVLGIAIMVLGVITVGQGIQARLEDKSQRQCLADNFGRLSTAINVRGRIADREATNRARDTANRVRSDISQTKLIIDAFSATDRAAAFRAFKQFQDSQKKVEAEQKLIDAEARVIAQARKTTKYPPFPPGTCEDALPRPNKEATNPAKVKRSREPKN